MHHPLVLITQEHTDTHSVFSDAPERSLQVQAVPSMAMTGQQELDLQEQHGDPTQEDGDTKEGGEKVHVSVEGEQRDEEEAEEEEMDSLPYPTLAPVVLLALTQTSPPRSWCLRAVCHPYPFAALRRCH